MTTTVFCFSENDTLKFENPLEKLEKQTKARGA